MTVNAISFDVEDWFQVENLKSAIRRDDWDSLELRVEQNTRRILAALQERGVKATFFILGWVAERCPELVREIDRQGHEVASHGYAHRLVYDMTPDEFRDDLARSKMILEDIVGKPVIGYRAPSFSITPNTLWALDILKETGFRYDSSIFPVSVHDRYGFPGCDTQPFHWSNGLLEIPLAVYKLGRLALPVAGGGYFRLFPYIYFRALLGRLNRRRQPFTFYLHPWEFDPAQPRVCVPWFYSFRHYVNLDKTESRLRKLLKQFRFAGIAAVHGIGEQADRSVSGRRIRIVFIIDQIGSNLAGTENQLIKIINGLDRAAFDVHLICFNEHPWFAQNRHLIHCPATVINLKQLKHPAVFGNFIRLVRWLRRERPDIVHTFFPIGNIVGVLGARLAGVPVVISSRRDYGEWMRPHYLAATRFANRFVTRIVTNSAEVRKLTARKEGFDAGRIDVIHNGIDAEPFSRNRPDDSLRRTLGIPDGHRVVGIVANFRTMKRHATLVYAAREILDRRPDVEFVLVGQNVTHDGQQQALEELASSLGVRDRFHFVGAQPEVARYLSIMDIGVNCSVGEGLSNAIMEYMAAGVACVVSDGGGNPDLIEADVHGLVFPVDDHAALARHILRLLAEPETRDRLVANARRRIDLELSIPAMLLQYQNFYRQITIGAGNHTVATARASTGRPRRD